jgi:hypothetical protein
MCFIVLSRTQVITTTLNGDMTFIGSQVEQFLKYKASDLIGSNILQIVVPKSQKNIQRLLCLTGKEQQRVSPEMEEKANNGSGSDKATSNGSSDANVVSLKSSEKSFPMQNIEVNLDDMNMQTDDADVSDSSADRRNNQSSIGDKKHTSKSNSATTNTSSLTYQKSSSLAESSDNGEPSAKKVKIADTHKEFDKLSEERLSSSNTNTTSSKSSDENQSIGLHRHKGSNPSTKPSAADRSYSSSVDSSQSQNGKKRSECGADDSGYRESESNESPEESSSSNGSSNEGGERKRG